MFLVVLDFSTSRKHFLADNFFGQEMRVENRNDRGY